MATETNYPELVAAAEQAVAMMKDPELKRIAFQRVLDDLLAASPKTRHRTRSSTGRKETHSTHTKGATRQGPQAYVEELVADGFFQNPKTIGDVRTELGLRGHHIPLTSLSGPLQKLCQRKQLRRQQINTDGKQSFSYSNW